jgi:colicin import membrane protein
MRLTIGTRTAVGGPSREQQAAQREAQRQAQIQAQRQAQIQAQRRAEEQARLDKTAADNARRKKEMDTALNLQAEKTRNETNLANQQKKATAEDQNQVAAQREREKMVRTFQTRRRGRASLRINLGSNSGSPYEGSSGISINL